MTTSLHGWELATVLMGGVATLAIFSFLIKENPFYRFFEHFFIGISAGLGAVLTFKNLLWPMILSPMLGLDIVTFPDGSLSKEYNPLYLLYLLPLLFGLLYYTVYVPRYAWMSKIVIGFSLGMSGGIAFKAFFSEWIPQIQSSFRPLLVWECQGDSCSFSLLQSFSNTVFILTLTSVMYYFFFSFRGTGERQKYLSMSGRWLMMICFGAFFGSTVMARMALLVERLNFLLNDWSSALYLLLPLE